MPTPEQVHALLLRRYTCQERRQIERSIQTLLELADHIEQTKVPAPIFTKANELRDRT